MIRYTTMSHDKIKDIMLRVKNNKQEMLLLGLYSTYILLEGKVPDDYVVSRIGKVDYNRFGSKIDPFWVELKAIADSVIKNTRAKIASKNTSKNTSKTTNV